MFSGNYIFIVAFSLLKLYSNWQYSIHTKVMEGQFTLALEKIRRWMDYILIRTDVNVYTLLLELWWWDLSNLLCPQLSTRWNLNLLLMRLDYQLWIFFFQVIVSWIWLVYQLTALAVSTVTDAFVKIWIYVSFL